MVVMLLNHRFDIERRNLAFVDNQTSTHDSIVSTLRRAEHDGGNGVTQRACVVNRVEIEGEKVRLTESTSQFASSCSHVGNEDSRLEAEFLKDAIRCQWQVGEADVGRIGDSVRKRRSNRIDRTLALRLGSERTNSVAGVGEAQTDS